MANVKFKALYAGLWANRVDMWGRGYTIFLSLATSGSVAAWMIWDVAPGVWGCIVALAHVLQIARPSLPYLGNGKGYLEMSYALDAVCLRYERLFFELDGRKVASDEAETQFYTLREEQNEIEKAYRETPCPDWGKTKDRVYEQVASFLLLNFGTGEQSNESRQKDPAASADSEQA